MVIKLQFGVGLMLYMLCTTIMAQQPSLEWAQRLNTLGSTSGSAADVAVDEEGNSYITGTSFRQGYIPQMTTIKYSLTGEQLWVVESEEYSGAKAIAVDNAGGVYVTGSSNDNYFTIRYDAATGEQAWVQRYTGPANSYDQAAALAVDNAGGVYVTGISFDLNYSANFATVRYDARTGEESWVRHYDGPTGGYDEARAIAVDNTGGVYVSGSSTDINFYSDYATVRYDAATGEQTWVQHYNGGTNSDDHPVGIATDNAGGVYVTGTSTGEEFVPDYATVRYDTDSGDETWVQRYNGPGNGYDQATVIAVDNIGGVYVTGSSTGENFDSDFATIRYEAATGDETWVQHYNHDGYDMATALTVDNAGGVYVTGASSGTDFISDFATIRYDATTGRSTWIQRYSASAASYESPAAIAYGNGGVTVTGSTSEDGRTSDFATVRYDAATGTENWTQQYESMENADDFPVSVSVDAAGNSYVTGTSITEGYVPKMTTVKYSPAGEQLWIIQAEDFTIARGMVVDNAGSIYTTAESSGDYLTTRYAIDTGEPIWSQRFDGRFFGSDSPTAIAVDNGGGVYVTGISYDSDFVADYATVRYEATTGTQTWVQYYNSPSSGNDIAVDIAVDNAGGIYVTGTSSGPDLIEDFATVRYNAATGDEDWVQHYGSPANPDYARAIAVDNMGGVYVTGLSLGGNGEDMTPDYATVRYDAATGAQAWAQQYDGPANDVDQATSIAVDNTGGVYVTGSSVGNSLWPDYATIRYEAATGDETWVQRYTGGVFNIALAIELDNTGGVYVTGTSYDNSTLAYTTVRYASATGEQAWVERYLSRGMNQSVAVDMALDSRGNIIITGYTYEPETGADFLTLKYSQCPAFADTGIVGSSTAGVGTAQATYTLSGTGATSFDWSITGSDGTPYTDFSGQGTEAIAVNWPSEPGVYQVALTYGGSTGCPTQTAVQYVHVFDTEAGFVTGGGWIVSPANTAYEFMQESGTAHWSFAARYMKGAENRVQGATQLLLEAGALVFRSSGVENRTLVIDGNTAYYRGRGTLSFRDDTGHLITDQRNFAYLVAATDGQYMDGRDTDNLRIRIWVLNEDGSQGAVVYDNQVTCLSSSLDEHLQPCSAIGQGFIVIHNPNRRSISRNALTAPETGPNLEVYPTAFSDRTTISFVNGQENTSYTLDLYDIKGMLIQRIAAGTAKSANRYEHELRAGSLAKGLYLARLTTGSKVQTVKLVVQR